MTEPPPEGKLAAAVSAVRSLSLTNVLIIALLALIGLPAYLIWKAASDPSGALMNRLLSSYQELPNQQSGCTLRTVRERGGPQRWSISTGFAFHGADRWAINVLLDYEPTGEQITSYCETLKMIADHTLMAPKP